MKDKKTKVKVCGIPFQVKEFEMNSRADMAMGRSDILSATIHLSKGLDKEIRELTLIHEWVHAILDIGGYDLESQNEQLVNHLANELYRQNFRVMED